jgi:hypothetical protein
LPICIPESDGQNNFISITALGAEGNIFGGNNRRTPIALSGGGSKDVKEEI